MKCKEQRQALRSCKDSKSSTDSLELEDPGLFFIGKFLLHEKWAKRLGVPKEVSRKVNEMSEIHRDARKTHRDHNVEQGRFTVSFQMLR